MDNRIDVLKRTTARGPDFFSTLNTAVQLSEPGVWRQSWDTHYTRATTYTIHTLRDET